MKKILISALAVFALCGVALLAQSSKTAAPTAEKGTTKTSSKYHVKLGERQKDFKAEDKMSEKAGCTIAKPGKGQICLYDIEQIPTLPKDHAPVYVSVGNEESILWYSSQGRGFHVSRLVPATAGCPANPFKRRFTKKQKEEWESAVHSGAASKDAVGCVYEPLLTVKVDGKIRTWDPHIIIGP